STENETNAKLLFGSQNPAPFVKDAFHEHVVKGTRGVVNPKREGTKAAWNVRFEIEAGGSRTLSLRLYPASDKAQPRFGAEFDKVFAARREEQRAFYAAQSPANTNENEARVLGQAYAGLMWS